MSGRFGGKRYASIVAEIEAAGLDASGIVNSRDLYVLLARFKGLAVPDGFRPSFRQSRYALSIYRQKGVLADLAKPVNVSIDSAGFTSEDVLALGSQARRDGNIVRLFLAQQGKCHYCRREMALAASEYGKPLYATIDHVVPRCQGGTKAPGNVVAACADCNSRKGHMAYHLFMAIKGGAA